MTLRSKERIRDLRARADVVYGYLKDGRLEQLRQEHPDLSDEKIVAVLEFIQQAAIKGRKQITAHSW